VSAHPWLPSDPGPCCRFGLLDHSVHDPYTDTEPEGAGATSTPRRVSGGRRVRTPVVRSKSSSPNRQVSFHLLLLTILPCLNHDIPEQLRLDTR
jgi:hypothetical protein